MIQVDNLTKDYDGLLAVDHISFDIRRGEILGLLGPNGAGKTSTLRMLTGYLAPTSGTVRVKDYALDTDLLAIKQLMGYLPESAPLYHGMIVYDYLDYVARVRSLPADSRNTRIRQLMEICGLGGIMHRSIGELSKGLKQRVGLAHAMMNDPEILVLDEPTSGLDPNQIAEIRQIIRAIGSQKTVVLSTHILSEAEATCDRVVIIHQGKIVADDSTQALKQAASHETVIHISLEGATAAAVKDRLGAVPGVSVAGAIEEKDGVTTFKLGCRSETGDMRKVIYRAIRETDWILLDFHAEIKTLEHIFRELTKEN